MVAVLGHCNFMTNKHPYKALLRVHMRRSHRRMWLTNPPHQEGQRGTETQASFASASLLQHQDSTQTQRHAYPKDVSHCLLHPFHSWKSLHFASRAFPWNGPCRPNPHPQFLQHECAQCKHSPASGLPAAAQLSRARLTQLGTARAHH